MRGASCEIWICIRKVDRRFPARIELLGARGGVKLLPNRQTQPVKVN